MFTKLGGMLQGWLGVPLRSGLFFWLGGLALWLWSILNWDAVNTLRSGVPLAGGERLVNGEWLALWDFLRALHEPEAALTLAGIVTFMLLLSGVVKSLEFGVLRLLEGYGWPSRLRETAVAEKRHINPKLARWKTLAKQTAAPDTPLSAAEQWEYAAIDREVVYIPEQGMRMPTRLGNILRAYEQSARVRSTAWMRLSAGHVCGWCCPRTPGKNWRRRARRWMKRCKYASGACCFRFGWA